MSQDREAKDGSAPDKRMLAAGRRIGGTWMVRTFLRPASATTPKTFWEAGRQQAQRAR